MFAQQAAHIREQRSVLIEALARMPGVTPFPSDANMVLARVPDAQRSFDGLKARGVLVKNVSKMHPSLTNCLRLTVGTPEENAQLIGALQQVL
ncbi:Histidinol-phosphate aminotransferase 2 [compost metagenome]